MKKEDIKTYKDACKVIGRKPRRYKETKLNTFEQLSTIIAALNFISNNNSFWAPGYNYFYIYSWLYVNEDNKIIELLRLSHSDTIIGAGSGIGSYLRIKEEDDGNYVMENFRELLKDWFWINLKTL